MLPMANGHFGHSKNRTAAGAASAAMPLRVAHRFPIAKVCRDCHHEPLCSSLVRGVFLPLLLLLLSLHGYSGTVILFHLGWLLNHCVTQVCSSRKFDWLSFCVVAVPNGYFLLRIEASSYFVSLFLLSLIHI